MNRERAIALIFSAMVFGGLLVGTLTVFALGIQNFFSYVAIVWLPYHATVIYKKIPKGEVE